MIRGRPCTGWLALLPTRQAYIPKCRQGRFRPAATDEWRPTLTPRGPRADRFPHPLKHVAPRDSTGIAFVNRRAQGGQLGLVPTLFALKRSQGRPHNLTGVFVTSVLDLFQYEAVEFVSQIDVAG